MRVVVLLLMVAGCHSVAGPRCFAEGVPPPWHYVQAGHELIDGLDATQKSAAACPLDRPSDGAACGVAADASCFYVPPSTPCDPNELTCKDGTWSGEHVQF